MASMLRIARLASNHAGRRGTIWTCRGMTSSLAAATRVTLAAAGKQFASFSSMGSVERLEAPIDTFPRRHIGPNEDEQDEMLSIVGAGSLDELVNECVPDSIRLSKPLDLPEPVGERQSLRELRAMMNKNKTLRSHIGMGYYGTITPPVILRNVVESPAWYTPYTPYQAEIAQGRLEMLLNYQTMVCDLTGMPVANASLLDEGTAAAEAMTMTFNLGNEKCNRFLVDEQVFPQTLAVVKTRAKALGISVESLDVLSNGDASNICGVLVQYPSSTGSVESMDSIVKAAHEAGAKVVVASDLLALVALTPPGEWGADIVVGSSQRFGVPLGYGGPHAAFFACQSDLKRKAPGRIIGVSKDSAGDLALRMALQTREQHIRRDKATSNICTAQALLANVAASYAVFHGPCGLRAIAEKVHVAARTVAAGLERIGAQVVSAAFFDTVHIRLPTSSSKEIAAAGVRNGFNLRAIDEQTVTLSMDETVELSDITAIFAAFAEVLGTVAPKPESIAAELDSSDKFRIPDELRRSSTFLTHPTFNSYHSETDMLRYLYSLQQRDLSLATAMIPLGSCTMKLNATSEMIPVTWPSVSDVHPFVPLDQGAGYEEMVVQMCQMLCEITGFDAVSMQPNSGSQGEYAGLRVIQQYHEANGQGHRSICLIPTSAHGTNPATAAMCGLKVVPVKCDDNGNIDIEDLREKAKKYSAELSSFMITYPSTHGVFEATVQDLCQIVHEQGGQVYMDGANMNAQVGLTNPVNCGADVCHLNLHKTFCIPHGGGGPGLGPIGVRSHLAPYLPTHPLRDGPNDEIAVGPVAAAPYSSASIIPISWMYVRMMGSEGLTRATQVAILNANYMKDRLKDHFEVLYVGANDRVAHEFILDARPFKKVGITEEDIAKRLMDYNFHGPTMSWPVGGTLMIEPTESEPKRELDRFCDALIKIREEIREVEEGKISAEDSVLRGAPHTSKAVVSDSWVRKYSREQAAFPQSEQRRNKFWPSVGRIDNVFGDRNVQCQCPPMSAYGVEE